MQFISTATLRNLGFSDPTKVRVYGLGGRPLPATLTAANADDLPIVASTANSRGLYFYGYGSVDWTMSAPKSTIPFTHTLHPYAEESYYFLSDSDEYAEQIPVRDSGSASGGAGVITSFIQPLLYETDLYHPSDTGQRYLGDDFRSPTRRSYNFTLTDAVAGQNCMIRVAFAANTSASSTLTITANGNSPVEASPITLTGNSDINTFMRYSTGTRTLTDPGNSLRLDLAFSGGGTIRLARLDYIEVQYQRNLNLASTGELHFFTNSTLPAAVKIAGADNSAIVWDITDQGNPMIVDASLSGSDLTFVTPSGTREYVAFLPDKCTRSITGGSRVANQDLHSLPVPDMLIIAPAAFRDAAERLAAHHRDFDGLTCHVIEPELIYNEFSSGTPDVTAFRRLLKMWYDRGLAAAAAPSDDDDTTPSTIKYCLILGRGTFDNKIKMDAAKNAGYPFVPIWESPTGESQTSSYATDDYIGMLADCSTFEIGKQKIQVAVGRMPFMSTTEATYLTDKYINYVERPATGSWRNRLMFVADDQNQGDHLIQSEDMISSYTATEAGRKFRIERLYLDTFTLEQSSRGPTYPEAKEKMLRLWNDGVMMINYIGHASTVSWTHEDLLNWSDISSFSNRNFPFLYAATCEFGRFDASARSGAEALWAYSDAGIIGTVTPCRTVYIDMNGKLSHLVGEAMMKPDADGRSRRIGDIFVEAKNGYPSSDNTNKLRYVLIGNPAMRLPVPEYDVRLSSINDVDMAAIESPSDYPTLGAQGKAALVGEIRDRDGNVATDFNGTVEISLYDAESAVATNGNGDAGVVSYYNDRKTLLYQGVAKVAEGKWSTTALLPSEIENNFAPAQFLFYAASDDLKEAHGENSCFYVYGFDESTEPDVTGPTISRFVLNRDDFTPGSVVHCSPVVLARVSDPSGINISDAGIGHKMTLVLDEKTYYDNLNSYYSPDPDDFTAGDITYQLADLTPGRHTLKLTVWDNAKNSSSAVIDFEVAVAKAPEIFTLTSDANPARDHVNFTLSTDRPMANVGCTVEVFDLNGRRVWISDRQTVTDSSAALSVPWDLCDSSGVRVERGIYIYRATITSPEGPSTSTARKLAVAAP